MKLKKSEKVSKRASKLEVNLVLKLRFPISTMSGMSRGGVKSPKDGTLGIVDEPIEGKP